MLEELPYTRPGTEAPRFPALARRRHTFDAFVRRRSEDLAPVKFRRAFVSRQKKVCAISAPGFLQTAPQVESTPSLRLSRAQRARASSFEYNSRRKRQLYRRGVISRSSTGATKRLALSTPTDAYRRVARHTPVVCISNAVLLQTALKNRYTDRSIRDLRQAGRQRVLYGSQAPFWARFAIARREQLLKQHVPYSPADTAYFAQPTSFS